MTMNIAIAVVNTGIALALLWLGGLCFWQARRWLVDWPITALAALGSVFIAAGVIIGHLVLLRLKLHLWVFDRDGFGTLGVRLIALLIVLAMGQRVLRGSLLTVADRTRLRPGIHQ